MVMRSRRALLVMLLLTPALLSAQDLRIASYNVGSQHRDYMGLAKVINNFDVVAAEEVTNAGGLEKALGALAEGWEAAISDTNAQALKQKELIGFFYDERVELYRMLGPYPDRGLFSRAPYGANFKVKGSPFSFNLIACHIDSAKGPQARAAEISRLGDVYAYFEKLTGNRGISIMAGDFGERRIPFFGGQQILDQDNDHIFVSANLRPRVERADVLRTSRSDATDHCPVYIVLRAGP